MHGPAHRTDGTIYGVIVWRILIMTLLGRNLPFESAPWERTSRGTGPQPTAECVSVMKHAKRKNG